MNFSLHDLLAKTSFFSAIVPLMAFILAVRKKEQTVSIKLLGVFIIVAGLCDLLGFIFIKSKINPNAIGSIYSVLQFMLLCLIYSREHLFIKKINFVLTPLFIFFAIINLFELQEITGISSNLDTVSAAIFIPLSAVTYYKLFADSRSAFQMTFMFWFNTGVFIYFAGNVFTFATLDNLIREDENKILLLWTLHNLFNIVKNVIFAVGFYIAMRFDQEEQTEVA